MLSKITSCLKSYKNKRGKKNPTAVIFYFFFFNAAHFKLRSEQMLWHWLFTVGGKYTAQTIVEFYFIFL